ncbi:hypothetical protein MAA_10666 [Metarhizium robertsii ARSEF 23]|uniref:Uncharacterized protein n=1 Tax=Metarhizium robertsii (strain ARSEF 23 / ATCC MYA-3075) TaxID=655844 RepID=A0A0B2XJT8_METRA|nr:uncharacterized protein MAA_10666 [Metarhizium robertsii ARSEF 23]KHO11722.1 hypothetical protein MAA_10666 [Metarhizium robertsii ARSEF 23]
MLRGAADVDHRHLLVSRIAVSVSPYGVSGTGADAAAPPVLDIDSANRQRQSDIQDASVACPSTSMCSWFLGADISTRTAAHCENSEPPHSIKWLWVSARVGLASVGSRLPANHAGTAGASGP